MDVVLELHAPGLDLHQTRWNYHFILMKEVQERRMEFMAFAREAYRRQGRGTLWIDRDQWRDFLQSMVRKQRSEPLPCSYVGLEEAVRFGFGLASTGFVQILRGYDPAEQLVLTVQHYTDDQLSCYLIRGVHAE